MGFRVMAYADLDDAPVTVFSVLTTNGKSHDPEVVIDTPMCWAGYASRRLLGRSSSYRNWDSPDSMMQTFPAALDLAGADDRDPPELHAPSANRWRDRINA